MESPRINSKQCPICGIEFMYGSAVDMNIVSAISKFLSEIQR